jgi:hypothetical protein
MSAPPLRTEILRTEAALDALRIEWQAAAAADVNMSLFLTWDYLGALWRHFHRSRDEPWLVVVRRKGELVGLLPLVLSRRRAGTTSLRVLRSMGQWEGEGAGVLAAIAADQVWQAAFAALVAERQSWDALDLRQLDEQAWPLQHLHEFGAGWHCEVITDGAAVCQPLQIDWSELLAHSPEALRLAWQRRENRWQGEQGGPLQFEVADTPTTIGAAFDRYLALEQRSRRSARQPLIGVHARRASFYRELLPQLAAQRKAAVWLALRQSAGESGVTEPVAGLIRLFHRDEVYERHFTADKAYARYAPATALTLEVLRRSLGGRWRESVLPAGLTAFGQSHELSDWYGQRRKTCRLVVRQLQGAVPRLGHTLVGVVRGLGRKSSGAASAA